VTVIHETIDKVTYVSQQSVYHTAIVGLQSKRIARVNIRRNAYDFQSNVVGELWCSGGGWKEVFDHPIHIYKDVEKLSYVCDIDGRTHEILDSAVSKAVLLLQSFCKLEA